jgi:type II secretory pathway pseudopilin PulG
VRAADLSREDGLGIIEVLVAAIVLIIALLAAVAAIDGSRTLVNTSERKEAAANEAERALEQLESLPYASAGLTAAPGTSTNPDDPRVHVQPGTPASFRWNIAETPAKYESIVTEGGTISPIPLTWSNPDGRLKGTIHRFVTWVDDSATPAPTATKDYKRLTVAVTVDGDAPPRKPIFLTSLMRNPAETK